MPLHSLLYISNSCIAPKDAPVVVKSIAAKALKHNPAVGLTGALLFTGTHFAQILEGARTAIDQLMEQVIQDPRHDHLVIVDKGPLKVRQFADWSMAYFGPSLFVSRHVTRLLNNPSPQERRRAAEWLTELMRQFSNK
ncbi:MAG: BLUF domain-containing protein [Novosphingobium sp.]|uniref:BLUF domain-containing protein n=1 Tax=Novosphingobium sp. TaxID=1874826 RepID=UPI0027360088|nr:BLUF domain-containing protein [Novosphingobium sp.]MDP3551949.1 BLUF domain-containing protein [Novosphingobium sp.]